MTPLARLIAEEIHAAGPMTVTRFIELALAHPRFGYYRTRDPLGRGGDFITAPEVSQMFGEMVGLWLAVAWQSLGAPAAFTLAELGPGRGTLMADALRAAHAQPGFIEAMALNLVETSPVLRERQAETLGAFTPAFHDRPETLPDGPILVLANEFFDALPVRQLVATAGGWAERCIAATAEGTLGFTTGPIVAGADLPADAPANPADGSIWELAPDARGLARALAERCVGGPGAALIIDYGHGETALGDTLQAVSRHGYCDPLDDPGNVDLTTHVDFAALARAADGAGARVFGPVSQGRFLLALGIAVRAERLRAAATPKQALDIDQGLKRLLAPSEMGNLFKVMAVAAPDIGPLPGFEP